MTDQPTREAVLLLRAYEVVHHDDDCPSIGGNGDADCRCDAVPFLNELETVFLDYRPADDERRAIRELGVAQDLSAGAVIRQALRLYQADYYRRRAGETCTWSGDEARAREFVGALSTPIGEPAVADADDTALFIMEGLRNIDFPPLSGDDCLDIQNALSAILARHTTPQPARDQAVADEREAPDYRGIPGGDKAVALSDLIAEASKLPEDFPNYGDWPVTLPAGHWRAICSALRATPEGQS